MKKTILTIFVFVLILLFICSCGKNKGKDDISQTESSESILQSGTGQSSETESSAEESRMPWEDYSDENPMEGSRDCVVAVKYFADYYGDNSFENYYIITDGNTIIAYFVNNNNILTKMEATVHDNGNLKEVLYYIIESGRFQLFYRDEYDERGKIVKQTVYRIGNVNNLFTGVEYVYDSEGNLAEEIYIDQDVLNMRIIYHVNENKKEFIHYNDKYGIYQHVLDEYDDDGNIIKEYCILDDGTPVLILDTKFDDNGNKTEQYYYNEEGNLNTRTEFVRDDNGAIVEENIYSDNGKMISHTEYGYDANGNQIMQRTYYGSDSYQYDELISEYDENGNIIKRYFSSGGVVYLSTDYRYNDDGKLIEQNVYNNGRFLHGLESKYDDDGRISKIVKYNDSGEIGFVGDYKWVHVRYPDGFYVFIKEIVGEDAVIEVE